MKIGNSLQKLDRQRGSFQTTCMGSVGKLRWSQTLHNTTPNNFYKIYPLAIFIQSTCQDTPHTTYQTSHMTRYSCIIIIPLDALYSTHSHNIISLWCTPSPNPSSQGSGSSPLIELEGKFLYTSNVLEVPLHKRRDTWGNLPVYMGRLVTYM